MIPVLNVPLARGIRESEIFLLLRKTFRSHPLAVSGVRRRGAFGRPARPELVTGLGGGGGGGRSEPPSPIPRGAVAPRMS
ncbi:hypothetical protein NL676_033571 [Syzygium grande]|nr:hypothetical protein NL676_033571 [Syzygium grande]